MEGADCGASPCWERKLQASIIDSCRRMHANWATNITQYSVHSAQKPNKIAAYCIEVSNPLYVLKHVAVLPMVFHYNLIHK